MTVDGIQKIRRGLALCYSMLERLLSVGFGDYRAHGESGFHEILRGCGDRHVHLYSCRYLHRITVLLRQYAVGFGGFIDRLEGSGRIISLTGILQLWMRTSAARVFCQESIVHLQPSRDSQPHLMRTLALLGDRKDDSLRIDREK